MKTKRNAVLHKMVCLLLLSAICIGALAGCDSSKDPEITAEYIGSKLEPMSELVSSKMTYNGLIHYSDGKIPFLTKKAFLMVYCAEVKAGIDLSKVDIKVSETNVTISVPKDISLDIKVLPESIEFYSEKNALFNKDEMEDAVSAIQAAEENVLEFAGVEQLKDTARKQAILLITNLVEELIGDKTLTVVS